MIWVVLGRQAFNTFVDPSINVCRRFLNYSFSLVTVVVGRRQERAEWTVRRHQATRGWRGVARRTTSKPFPLS